MFKLTLADNNQMDFVDCVLTLNNFKEGTSSFINSNIKFFLNQMSLLKLESVNIMFIGTCSCINLFLCFLLIFLYN